MLIHNVEITEDEKRKDADHVRHIEAGKVASQAEWKAKYADAEKGGPERDRRREKRLRKPQVRGRLAVMEKVRQF